MDRIMQDFWKSNIDVSGSFLEASTSYQILTRSSLDISKDEEKGNRFYKFKDVSSFKSHSFQFCVWMKSMQIRYTLESISFVALAFVFQYFISIFNADTHKVRED